MKSLKTEGVTIEINRHNILTVSHHKSTWYDIARLENDGSSCLFDMDKMDSFLSIAMIWV